MYTESKIMSVFQNTAVQASRIYKVEMCLANRMLSK